MRRACRIIVSFLALWTTGCMLGPTALKVSHIEYNQALRASQDQQLLLNLVRLRYRDSPVFLDVNSISAQFTIEESADITGTLNEGATRDARDRLEMGAGIGFSERPTFSFTPLKGEAFVKRMLAPAPLETLILMINSGWSAERVIRLTVRQINGVDNASTASGPTPATAPDYEAFAEVSEMLRALQGKGIAWIAFEEQTSVKSDPIPAASVSAEDLLNAASQGYRFAAGKGGATYTLTTPKQVPVFYIVPQAVDAPEVQQLVETLGLAPGRTRYELELAFVDPGQSGKRKSPEKMTLATRSLLGTMFYLCHAVQVPRSHEERGLVTITRDASGQPFDWSVVLGDLLCIRSGRTPPVSAAVRVFYRGHWFYIDDADLESKSTFTLLVQLFALQAGREANGTGPVLTLPIGG